LLFRPIYLASGEKDAAVKKFETAVEKDPANRGPG